MNLQNKINRKKLGALSICFASSLGMSFFIGKTNPIIALMLSVITVGVYIMIISGKWNLK